MIYLHKTKSLTYKPEQLIVGMITRHLKKCKLS